MTNDPRSTAHDQRPRTNDPRPTTNGPRPTTHDPRPTTDVPVNKERRHEFVWVVWTRQGKIQDNAEDDASFAGRREYTRNVDEIAPLARFGKRDERVGLEPKEANDAVHAVVDFTAEDAEEQWVPHGSGHPELMVEKKTATPRSCGEAHVTTTTITITTTTEIKQSSPSRSPSR